MANEESFHFNFDLHEDTDHYLNVVKTRLWPYIIMCTNWLIKSTAVPSSNNVRNGLGLMIINNLAIAVEGFMTDIIAEHLENSQLEKIQTVKDLDHKGWGRKKSVYNSLFAKKIETYLSFDAIEHLLQLRNNTAHGKTHLEVDKKHKITGKKEIITSHDSNYQQVRDFLILRKVIQPKINSSNVDVLWTLNIALFFCAEIRTFLFALIQSNESDKKASIEFELRSAYSNIY